MNTDLRRKTFILHLSSVIPFSHLPPPASRPGRRGLHGQPGHGSSQARAAPGPRGDPEHGETTASQSVEFREGPPQPGRGRGGRQFAWCSMPWPGPVASKPLSETGLLDDERIDEASIVAPLHRGRICSPDVWIPCSKAALPFQPTVVSGRSSPGRLTRSTRATAAWRRSLAGAWGSRSSPRSRS